MLALFAANHGAVMPALQPALQLRGGMSIGGVEPEQVATGLNLLLGVQGLMMIQNQEKIHEIYDVFISCVNARRSAVGMARHMTVHTTSDGPTHCASYACC